MKTAFTLCSLNYLPRAKALGDSLLRHNPDYRFIIGLIDRLDGRAELARLAYGEVLEVDKIGIPGFGDMVRNYNIIELNTSVKPFYFEYLFANTGTESVVYFDPDIYLYRNLSELDGLLAANDIVLTPHIITPNLTGRFFPESLYLRFGLYNLGFIAVRRSQNSLDFLHWWGERTSTQGFDDSGRGTFVDQLWINLAPIFFKGVHVEKNPGYNMAWWNFHERTLSKREGAYWVNDSFPLTFFHFSGFDPRLPAYVNKRLKVAIAQRPDLGELYVDYGKRLLDNRYDQYRSIKCRYDPASPRKIWRRIASIVRMAADRLP